MAAPTTNGSYSDQVNAAIATATQIATSAAKVASKAVQVAADEITGSTIAVGKTVGPEAVRFVEQGTETVGKFVSPIAENPLIKYAAKVPGINILLAALGQVDVEKA